MKFTITHRNKKNQLLVSTKSLERFLERIVNDDARNTVENFREYVPYLTNGYANLSRMLHSANIQFVTSSFYEIKTYLILNHL